MDRYKIGVKQKLIKVFSHRLFSNLAMKFDSKGEFSKERTNFHSEPTSMCFFVRSQSPNEWLMEKNGVLP